MKISVQLDRDFFVAFNLKNVFSWCFFFSLNDIVKIVDDSFIQNVVAGRVC